MPLFFFLFWGTLIVLLAGGWLLSGGLAALAHWRKWRVIKWISGAAFAGFTLIWIGGFLLLGYGCYRSHQPELVFEDAFGRKPPPGTIALHGRQSGFADSAGRDLAFRTDHATFRELIREDFESISLEQYRSQHSRYPAWWREPTHSTQIWVKDRPSFAGTPLRSGQHFYSEHTLMTWDEDGLAQYSWWGID